MKKRVEERKKQKEEQKKNIEEKKTQMVDKLKNKVNDEQVVIKSKDLNENYKKSLEDVKANSAKIQQEVNALFEESNKSVFSKNSTQLKLT